MIPVYRTRDTYLHSVHPAVQTIMVFSLAFLSLSSENLFLQVAVIAACFLISVASGTFREWASWWKICAAVGLMAVIINPLVSRAGATVIWMGPHLPVIGRLDITLEAIVYGVGMGLRLSALILAFALFSLLVDPDKILGLIRGRGSRSALLSALTMKMVPTAMRDAGAILDAQRARGVVKDSGGRLNMLKSRAVVLGKLVSTGLERAIGLAEAMESRAYGSGRRTRYQEYELKKGDIGLTVISIAMAAFCTAFMASGFARLTCYPRISFSLSTAGIFILLIPILFSILIFAVSWSWKRWNWLKLRI